MIETTYPAGPDADPVHRLCCDSCGRGHQHSSSEGGARQYARDALWAVHLQEDWDKLPADRCPDCYLAFEWLRIKGWTWERQGTRWKASFGRLAVYAIDPKTLRDQVDCWLRELAARRHTVLIAE